MTTITRSADCGNSPKNQLLEDVEIALATGDLDVLLERVTDDVCLTIVGRRSVHGVEELSATVKKLAHASTVTEIAIHHVVSHGKAGAVNGTRKHRNGKTYEFCTVYEFSTAKGTHVQGMKHYAIEQG